MLIKFPKNDKNFHWTQHIKDKMIFYRLSEQKIRQILRNPQRKEEGVAPETMAAMRRNDTKKRKEEVWVMYAKNVRSEKNKQAKRSIFDHQTSNKFIMISAWRYPGVSKPGKMIPIPEEILAEIQKEWF